jgi:anaerobic ribonucleoside-triphosphate reductase activating protein
MVVWTQGCEKQCRGCFNPETWDKNRGIYWDTLKLAEYVRSINPEGLTITGGDPLEQAFEIHDFLKQLHCENGDLPGLPLGIIMFTGFTREEIDQSTPNFEAAKSCLGLIDVLIDGRYEQDCRVDNMLAGSSNQRFFFNDAQGRGRSRIPKEQLLIDQHVEVHNINDDGAVAVTGFPYIDREMLRQHGLRITQ